MSAHKRIKNATLTALLITGVPCALLLGAGARA